MLFSSSHGDGQNSITLSTHYGIDLTNSENSTPIIGEQSLRGFMGGTVGYTHPFSKNFALGIDLGYCTSTVNNIQQFVLTGVNTPNPIGFFYAHMSYKQFFSDVSLRYAITDLFSVGGGPSFSIIHHWLYDDMPS